MTKSDLRLWNIYYELAMKLSNNLL